MSSLFALRGPSLAAVLCFLVACSGGGGGGGGDDGGGGTSISVSPTNVSFRAIEGGGEERSDVLVTYSGDGVVVGFPPGESQPSWLSISQASGGSESPIRFALFASPTEPPGSYSTVVRFATGRADGSNVRIQDVPVSYVIEPGVSFSELGVQRDTREGQSIESAQLSVDTGGRPVELSGVPDWITATLGNELNGARSLLLEFDGEQLPSDFSNAELIAAATDGSGAQDTLPVNVRVQPTSFSASPAQLSFDGVCGQTEPFAAQTINLEAEVNGRIRVEGRVVDQDDRVWLDDVAIVQTPAQVNIAPTNANLTAGARFTSLRFSSVRFPSRGSSVDVFYRLIAPELAAAGETNRVVGVDTTEQDLAFSLTISDTGAPLDWRVVSTGANWLAADATSGNTRTSATLPLRVDSDVLAGMANGNFDTTLALEADTDCAGLISLDVPVSLALALPVVRGVAPGVALVGQSRIHGVGGTGFDVNLPPAVLLDDTPLQPEEAVSSSGLRLRLPVLAAGTYTLTIDNALEIDRGSATLRVVDALTAAAEQTIESDQLPVSTAYSSARQAYYSLEVGSDRRYLFVFQRTAGVWMRSELAVLANALNIALSADENTLWIAASDGLYGLDLDTAGASPVRVLQYQDSSGPTGFDGVSRLADGRLLLMQASGFGDLVLGDPEAGTADQLLFAARCTEPHSSADGLVGAFSETGCSSPSRDGYWRYTLGDTEAVSAALSDEIGSDLSISPNGALLAKRDRVYDFATGAPIATVPFGGPSMFSADGERLYLSHREGGSGGEPTRHIVEVFDVSQGPIAGTYPSLRRFDVTDRVQFVRELLVTPDEELLIVGGAIATAFIPLQ